MWLEALEWSGKEGYNAAQLDDWHVDGKEAGQYKNYGPLTVSTRERRTRRVRKASFAEC